MLGYRIPRTRCHGSMRSTGIPLGTASTRLWCIPESPKNTFSTQHSASRHRAPGIDFHKVDQPAYSLPWLHAESIGAGFISRARREAAANESRLCRGHAFSDHAPCTLLCSTTAPHRPSASTSPTKRPRSAGRVGSVWMIQHLTRMIGARHFGSSCTRNRGIVIMMDAASSCSGSRRITDICPALSSAGWIQNERPSTLTSPFDRLQHRISAFRQSRFPCRTTGIASFGLGMAYLRRSGRSSLSEQQQAAFSSSTSAQHGSHDHPAPTGATSSTRSAAVPDAPIANDVSGGLRSRTSKQTHEHDHGHEHDHDHSHDHSHSLFHSHAHDHSASAGELVSALSRNDRGSRITLLGLASNVLLTALKGVAGYVMNSASLIAEAGHSFSDLGADFVTLACWKVSRRDPTRAYPYGYGKFETIGTLSVSLILVVAGIGIALHSYHLLLQVMIPWIHTLDPSNPLQSLLPYIPSSIPSPLLELFHSHGPGAHGHDLADAAGATVDTHESVAILNPHAAWFALISVFIKEWLFRVTKKVADEEHSPVLLANAYHHRSDALTSGVALFSILGSHYGAPVLDPLGGIVVSIFILQQGLALSRTSFLELLDKGITDEYRTRLERIVEPLVNGRDLLEIRNIRGVKAGGLTSLDLTITVPPTMSVLESHAVEANVRDTIMRQRKEVRELKIHVHAQEEGEVLDGIGAAAGREKSKLADDAVKHDFGRNGC